MKLGSTRQAIHDALSWGWHQRNSGLTEFLDYLTQIQKSQRPNGSAADMLEAAYICAAIDSLGSPVGKWLRFAYEPEPSESMQTQLATYLRWQVPRRAKSNAKQLTQAKWHLRLHLIASTALEDYRFGLRRNTPFPVTVYTDRIGMQAQNWKRDGYSEILRGFMATISTWDKDGVGHVSRMVRCLRGEAEEDTQAILHDIKRLHMISKYA